MNTATVGQIHFTACLVSRSPYNKWEFEITSVQSNKGFEDLVDTAPEYSGVSFNEARVSHCSKHKVQFTDTGTPIELIDEVQYAALISRYPGGTPYILSVCTEENFQQVLANRPTKAVVAQVQQGTFKCTFPEGNRFVGDLSTIMHKATMEWGKDPTHDLQDPGATWMIKAGDKYIPTGCPNLPPVNTMTLNTAKAAHAAKMAQQAA